MNDQPQSHEDIVEEALNDYPLEPLPDNFVNQVMTRIQMLTPEPISVRFQLDFLDWAIPVFLAIFALIFMVLIRQGSFLYGLFGGEAEPATAVLSNLSPNWLIIIGLIVVLEIFLAGVVAVWLWFDQPLPPVRHS